MLHDTPSVQSEPEPKTPMRIGKRHDPDDDFFAAPRPSANPVRSSGAKPRAQRGTPEQLGKPPPGSEPT